MGPPRFLLLAMVTSAVFAIGTSSYGQTATVSNVITNPQFVNIYWDANWAADTRIPQPSLDSFTAALVNSTYFAGLEEYGVTGAASPLPGFQASPSCGNGGTSPNTVNLFDILNFVTCEATQPHVPVGSNVIYNIFLAPTTTETDTLTIIPNPLLGFSEQVSLDGRLVSNGIIPPVLPWPFGGSVSSCKQYAAYHFSAGSGLNPLVFTAIFANPSCLGSSPPSPPPFSWLTDDLSHEMVEATTDPFPNLSVILTGGGEIADACEDPMKFPPTPFLRPFRGGLATRYFSNQAGQCITGFGDTTVPAFGSAPLQFSFAQSLELCPEPAICPAPLSVTIAGTGLGAPSGGLGSSFAPYFALTDQKTGIESGNSINGDATAVQYGPWSNTSILVGDPALVSGDSITVIVCNPASGMCNTSPPTTVPPIITSIYPTNGFSVGGTQVAITGIGFPTNGPISFNFGSVPGTGASCTSSTTCTVSSPAYAGTKSVRVSATVGGVTSPTSSADLFAYTPPLVSYLTPYLGPITGGTTVIISGDGFSTANTAIDFATTPATGTSCSTEQDCAVKSPPSPGNQPGSVEVTATAGGMTGDGKFLYYIDYSPILATSSTCGGSSSIFVDADVYYKEQPVSTPQQIQFTFTPASSGPSPITMMAWTKYGIAVVRAPVGSWTVTASNHSVPSSPPSQPIQIMAIHIPCPQPVGASDLSGFGYWSGWEGGVLPPIVLKECGGGVPCPGPLQPVIWSKRLGVDPEISSIVLQIETVNPAETASATHVILYSREQSSATFRRARGIEVNIGAPIAVAQAFFVGSVVSIQSSAPDVRVGSNPLSDVPKRTLLLTIPYQTQGVPAEASVGLFWLTTQSNKEVWTNAGVRIVSVTRGTVTAEIPHAGSFVPVAFVGRLTRAPAR